MSPAPPAPTLPRITLRFDRAIVEPDGGTRYLIVEIDAPARERAPRAPLDLALVLDVSGSMSGAKLAAAQIAAQRLIEHLRPEDRLSIVSFSSDVRVHLAAQPMTGTTADLARRELATLRPHANTNLSAGWLTGVTLLEGPAAAGRRRAVVVLSDGLANEGLVDPRELAPLARRSGEQGLATTCIGVGDDYSTAQLGTIAECSGGRFHDAATPDEILEVLLGELGEIGAVALQSASIELAAPAGFELAPRWSTEARRASASVVFDVGPVAGGARRACVLRVDVPPAALDAQAVFTARLAWTDPATGARRELECLPAVLRRGDASVAPASEADVLLVTRLECAWLERDLANLNEAGRYGEIATRLTGLARETLDYAGAAPLAAAEARVVCDRVREGAHPLDPRVRKDLHVAAWKQQRNERELRSRRTRGNEGT